MGADRQFRDITKMIFFKKINSKTEPITALHVSVVQGMDSAPAREFILH